MTTPTLSKWHQPSGPYTRRRDSQHWTTASTFLDSVSKERLIQEMPKDARQFIRERKPKDLLQAAALAKEFFANQERDFSSWDSSQEDKSNGGDKATPRDKQQDRTKH